MFCLAFIIDPTATFAKTDRLISKNADVQTLVYEVYAGGIHAVQAELVIDNSQKGRYDLFLYAKTRGLLGSLAPWEGTFESQGWIIGDEMRPELHRSSSIWKKEKEIKTYNYTKTGGFKDLVITEPGKEPKKQDIDPEITNGTTDAFTSALLALKRVYNGKPCTGSDEVFDGKRRFEQIFEFEKDVELKSSRYNVYEGPAQECTVEVKPISGAWHKKPRGWFSIQEQGRERGTMPTVWMGTLSENGPAIPVKIRVKTAYGTLFLHLTEYYNGKTALDIKSN